MSRALGIAVWALIGVVLLPAAARLAQAAVLPLLAVIAFLAIARLAWPTRKRR